jgi:hypothetical protein
MPKLVRDHLGAGWVTEGWEEKRWRSVRKPSHWVVEEKEAQVPLVYDAHTKVDATSRPCHGRFVNKHFCLWSGNVGLKLKLRLRLRLGSVLPGLLHASLLLHIPGLIDTRNIMLTLLKTLPWPFRRSGHFSPFQVPICRALNLTIVTKEHPKLTCVMASCTGSKDTTNSVYVVSKCTRPYFRAVSPPVMSVRWQTIRGVARGAAGIIASTNNVLHLSHDENLNTGTRNSIRISCIKSVKRSLSLLENIALHCFDGVIHKAQLTTSFELLETYSQSIKLKTLRIRT